MRLLEVKKEPIEASRPKKMKEMAIGVGKRKIIIISYEGKNKMRGQFIDPEATRQSQSRKRKGKT